jgi:2',3'-cyclic-nucleotide 2'-phosphodiesterase (5'-nucleotidase family)
MSSVGALSKSLVRAQTIAGQEARKRKDESPADSLFADIIREETASEIALLPGVGYGVAIEPGPLTEAALRNLIPHHSKSITMTLTGMQIRLILEQAVENTFTSDPTKKVGGMIQVSGLTFSYSEKQHFGKRVTKVSVGSRPLQEDRVYTVVTNAMLAEGGHNYRTFLEGLNKKEGKEVYAIVRTWFQRQASVEPAATGRITDVSEREE